MKTHVIACSQYDNLKESRGKWSILNSTFGGRPHEIDATKYSLHVVYNNKEPLPKKYNEFIEHYATASRVEYDYSDEDILVLVHDDVVLTDVWDDLQNKLVEGLKEYDIVGLAGGSKPEIKRPTLWHLMCPRDTHRGTVNHVADDKIHTFETVFGPQGRVLILDGLFLAFNPKKIYDAGVRFSIANPCVAHFYDIDFCLTANSKKLKLGTVPVKAVHASPGLREFTPDWLAGQEWFINKYACGGYNAT